MEKSRKKIKYEVLLETNSEGWNEGYFGSFKEAKKAVQHIRNMYSERDLKSMREEGGRIIIVNLKENYGRTFESVEDYEEFLESVDFINEDTNFVFEL